MSKHSNSCDFKYPYIYFPTETKNSTDFKKWNNTNKELYFAFYDCKGDNVMIDKDGNWRMIDIDGLFYYTEKTLGRGSDVPLSTGLPFCIFNNCYSLFCLDPVMKNTLEIMKTNNNLTLLISVYQSYDDDKLIKL